MADYLDQDYNYVVVKDLVYNTNYYNPTSMNHDPRLFDIYWNLDKQTNSHDLNYRPAIIYVHGGGFYYNNKNGGEARTIGFEFATRGYRVMAINYRLESNPIKAAEDVRAAVRFLRLNTQAARVRPDKIAVIGDSAGGLACLLAMVSDYEVSNGSNELTGYVGLSSLSRPNACIAMWAPYNTGFGWAGGVTSFNFNVTPTSTYIQSGVIDKLFLLHGNLDNVVIPANFYNLTGVIRNIKGSYPSTASAVLLDQSGHSAWGDNQFYWFPPVGNGPPAAGSLPNQGFIRTGLSSVVPWLKTQLGL